MYRGAAVLCGAEDDSNTLAFCAEGAKIIFFAKLDPETAKISLCKVAFLFIKLSMFRLWAKKMKNGEGKIQVWSSVRRV